MRLAIDYFFRLTQQPETLNSKPEARNPKQTQILKIRMIKTKVFRIPNFKIKIFA